MVATVALVGPGQGAAVVADFADRVAGETFAHVRERIAHYVPTLEGGHRFQPLDGELFVVAHHRSRGLGHAPAGCPALGVRAPHGFSLCPPDVDPGSLGNGFGLIGIGLPSGEHPAPRVAGNLFEAAAAVFENNQRILGPLETAALAREVPDSVAPALGVGVGTFRILVVDQDKPRAFDVQCQSRGGA